VQVFGESVIGANPPRVFLVCRDLWFWGVEPVIGVVSSWLSGCEPISVDRAALVVWAEFVS
jgi:hypothetical protein